MSDEIDQIAADMTARWDLYSWHRRAFAIEIAQALRDQYAKGRAESRWNTDTEAKVGAASFMRTDLERALDSSKERAEGRASRFDSSALDDAVADKVARLTNQLAEAEQQIASLTAALRSIANNSCCTPCREAALVAQAALAVPAPEEAP